MGKHQTLCRLKAEASCACNSTTDGRIRMSLPDELGHCYHEFVELEPGLVVDRLHYQPRIPLTEESNVPHNGRVMVITIGLEGRSCYRGQDTARLVFQKGHTTISSFYSTAGERRYEADETVSQLRIIAHEQLISRYVGQKRAALVLGNQQLSQLAFRASTPATTLHATALIGHLLPRRSTLSRLDLHIHTLSLLSEQLTLLAPENRAPASPFSPAEIDRIERVRQIMHEAIDKPFSLEYLATLAGINKNRLKEGMLYLYNCTPAEMLLQLRMNRALVLLKSGQQVSQVAWQVGYKYANNFTVAFTRYHGKSPKAMFSKKTQCAVSTRSV